MFVLVLVLLVLVRRVVSNIQVLSIKWNQMKPPEANGDEEVMVSGLAFVFIPHAGVSWSEKGCRGAVHILPLSVPANCLSPLPRLPNLVTSLPLSWKMKTQQALLSTTMTWPFLSTETPLGPISFPEPILFWKRKIFWISCQFSAPLTLV